MRRGRRPEDANNIVREASGADRRTIQRAAKAFSRFGDPKPMAAKVLLSIICQHATLSRALSKVLDPH